VFHIRRYKAIPISNFYKALASEWSTPFQEAKHRQVDEKCRKKMADFGFPAIFPATDGKNEPQTVSSEK